MQQSSIEEIKIDSAKELDDSVCYIAGIEGQILAKMRASDRGIILETVYRSDGSVEGVKISLCPL